MTSSFLETTFYRSALNAIRDRVTSIGLLLKQLEDEKLLIAADYDTKASETETLATIARHMTLDGKLRRGVLALARAREPLSTAVRRQAQMLPHRFQAQVERVQRLEAEYKSQLETLSANPRIAHCIKAALAVTEQHAHWTHAVLTTRDRLNVRPE